MPGQVHRLRTCRFRDTDQLLFDANVWLFLYSPQYGPNDSRVRVYSAAIKNILNARSRIFVDSLIFSEFINTWARFTYNKLWHRQNSKASRLTGAARHSNLSQKLSLMRAGEFSVSPPELIVSFRR